MRRLPAVVLLLVLGIVSLPLTAYFADGERSENWIVPVQLVAMAIVGALVGALLPLAGPGASTIRRIGIGVLAGVTMAVVGIGVFWLLLNGIRGA
ncbi:hypothetical protein ONR57_12120 [Hoyosella sp. YIM 151337]|uniref:hypothetical protein n=1 Tax=Hoyosella sp. YIM 151337 TaxID=2992742 RepID=UPI0022362598|nr:hypothetical protein [Hoyosella sp. YIM 151337]MCW4354046.1 hypothetical protein [Hoyosella sp. YIM 151337]